MRTIADKILDFYFNLELSEEVLPSDIKVMNPFKDKSNQFVKEIITKFYKKFYNDNKPRRLLLGINPGRFGGGVTGLPFTDTKRLNKNCGIRFDKFETHEPSSVFIYEMIEAYGGAEYFYSENLISAVSPLGFVKVKENGKSVNHNYYDSAELYESVKPFIINCLREHVNFNVKTGKVFSIGTGKNLKYLMKLNNEESLFNEIIAVEHPRYIMQYKSKEKQKYISKYLEVLK